MIVSKSNKFIYIHIFKTGGSTITEIISPYIDEEFRKKTTKKRGIGWQPTWHINKQHDKFSESLSILDSLDTKIDEYFLFTFVRNPYTWILSIWNNFYKYPKRNYQSNMFSQTKNTVKKLTNIVIGKQIFQTQAERFHELFPKGTFKEFIMFIDLISKEGTKKEKTYDGTYDQYSFIENNRGIEFDFIGKFENFQQDLNIILEKLNIEKPKALPHRNYTDNKTERERYLNYYDSESLAIVNRIFQRDFEIFDYQPINFIKK